MEDLQKQPELPKAARTLLWLAREKNALTRRIERKSPSPTYRSGGRSDAIEKTSPARSTKSEPFKESKAEEKESTQDEYTDDEDTDDVFNQSPLTHSMSVPYAISHMDSYQLEPTFGICSKRRKSYSLEIPKSDRDMKANTRHGTLKLVGVEPRSMTQGLSSARNGNRLTYFEATWKLHLPRKSSEDAFRKPFSLQQPKETVHVWTMHFTLAELVALETHMQRIYGHGKSKFRYSIRRKLLEARPWRNRQASDTPKGFWRATLKGIVIWLFWWLVTIALFITFVWFLTALFYGFATSQYVNLGAVVRTALLGPLSLELEDEAYLADLVVRAIAVAVACFSCLSLFQLARVLPTLLLPARILMESDRTHLLTVKKTLESIAANPVALESMTVCSFLGIGSATFSGMSSTLHEGKVFVRRHSKGTWHLSKHRRRRCTLCCFHCSWSFRVGFQTHLYAKRWAVLTEYGIVLFKDAMSEIPCDVLLFDSTFSVFRRDLVNGRSGVEAHMSEPVDDQSIFVVGAAGVLEVRAPTAQGTHQWANAINRAAANATATSEHRYTSTFPVRGVGGPATLGDWTTQSHCEWIRCGRMHFWEVARCIGAAKSQIMIADWYLTPHIRLIRVPPGCELPEQFKSMPSAVQRSLQEDADGARYVSLSKLLQTKFEDEPNLKVNILLLDEVQAVLPNNSAYVMKELGGLHPNLHILTHRSPLSIDTMWSHHEKIVAVDQLVAFIGGLDLCLERYDWPEHRLVDPQSAHWKGKDYANPRVRDVFDVEDEQTDMYSRSVVPRMPWVDVQVKLYGAPAKDVTKHFIQRWNFSRNGPFKTSGGAIPVLVPQERVDNHLLSPLACCTPALQPDQRESAGCSETSADCTPLTSAEGASSPKDQRWAEAKVDYPPFSQLESEGAGSPRPHACTVQVVRSVAEWSSGTRTETSIHAAMIDTIYTAQRFVYIENQYFCSGLSGDTFFGNRIADAIFSRILRAHELQMPFHVFIALPLIPAVEGGIAPDSSAALMSIISWQFRCISRGEGSIFQRLLDSGVDPSCYLTVMSLRTYGVADGRPLTEQVYVHSKLLVADDRVAIVGSANINDRSLLGMRDSEISVVIESSPGSGAGSSQSDGFAGSLRKACMAQHLGLEYSDMAAPRWSDPSSGEFVENLRKIARKNTEIFDKVFGCIPTDEVGSWIELVKRRMKLKHPEKLATSDLTKELETDKDVADALELLKQVQGFLVEYPLQFLKDEKELIPSGFHLENFLPRDLTS